MEFILLDILSLNSVGSELPQISPSIYDTLRGPSSTPISLGTLRKFQVSSLLEQKECRRTMGVAAEVKRIEAKDPPILQPDKKEHSPPSTRNRS